MNRDRKRSWQIGSTSQGVLTLVDPLNHDMYIIINERRKKGCYVSRKKEDS